MLGQRTCFVTLKKIFVLWILCSLLSWVQARVNQQHWRKCSPHNRKMLLFYQFFKTWLWLCLILLQVMQLIAWWDIWKVSPSLVVSQSFFPFQKLFFLILFSQLFSVHLWTHNACHHLFCRSQCMEVCLLSVGPRQDSLRYVLLLWNCFIHWSFCHKITYSILGPAFFSISMFCSSKIFQNTMQINVVSIYVVHHLLIHDLPAAR